jgi:hypothetical protein
MAGEAPDEADLRPIKRTGPQAETLTNKAIAQWMKLHPELLLGRNKRRLATPVGYHSPILLGWLVDGSADWIGYQTVVITPEMVGRRVARFVAIEAKRPVGGVVSHDQEVFLNAVSDAGGAAGVARNADDCERILTSGRLL